MKNEENVKQSKKKLNVVDIAVLIMVVCGLAAVVFLGVMMLTEGSDIFGRKEERTADFTYMVVVEKVDVQLYSITKGADNMVGCPSLQVGDKVYDRESGELIGAVSGITYRDIRVPTDRADENGNAVYADYPGYVDLVIAVEAYNDGKNGVYGVNGYEIRSGADISFRTYGFYADGRIESVASKTPDAEGGAKDE